MPRPTKACLYCGVMFTRHPKHSRAQWDEVQHCSPACSNKARGTHGARQTRLYKVWAGIKTRCLNANDPTYLYYGARGITIHPEWVDSFEAFASHIGDDPGPAFQVGRKDNDKGYEPGNVRWETRVQNANNKRTTRWVTYQGQNMSLREAARLAGVDYKKAWRRLKDGWNLEEALGPA